ncbi:MAG: hypothetical protein ABSH44_22380 [Bryobacteraceae bacterium]|jgi:tetratricopeptide (TPR) repeat protein
MQPTADPLEPCPPQKNPFLSAIRTHGWIVAALCGITLVAYANSFGMGFAMDGEVIVQDSRIRAVSTDNLNLILLQDYWWPNCCTGLYRPVTTISFLVNYAILGNGESAAGYHWVNFLLHLGNVGLVCALSLRMLKRTWPAFFAAALWAVHPIGTESVTYIAGRPDLLAAMAVLGGLWLYVRSTALRGVRAALAAAALFVVATVGVFSKENAAVLAGLMLLWDTAFGVGGWRQGARRLPLYAAAAASLALLWWVRRQVFAPLPLPANVFLNNPIIGADFWTARLTAIKVIGLDLWLLVWPAHLSCDRSYNQIPLAGWSDPFAWLSLLTVAAVLGVALARRRRDPLMFFLAGFVGITLLPTSNLVFPIRSILGERFLYLPSVGFAMAVAALAYRLGRERLTAVALAAVIAVFAARTFTRNFVWKDDYALFSSDVRVAPRSFKLHRFLARQLLDRDPVRNIDRVIQEAETAWNMIRSLPPELILQDVPSDLGEYYTAKGDLMGGMMTAQGRALYQQSLAVLLQGREADRARQTKHDELTAAHGKPLTTRAGFPKLYWDLGRVYARLERHAESLEALRHGRNLHPDSAAFYDAISQEYQASGDAERARIALVEKTLMSPNDPDTIPALRELYRTVPGGACAIDYLGGKPALHEGCPRVWNDLCEASADLVRAFVEARLSDRARRIAQTVIQQHACPAAPFEAALAGGPVP